MADALIHTVSAVQRKRFVLSLALAINALSGVTGSAEKRYGAAPQDIKESMDRLVRAYPDKIRTHDNDFRPAQISKQRNGVTRSCQSFSLLPFSSRQACSPPVPKPPRHLRRVPGPPRGFPLQPIAAIPTGK